MSTPARPLLLSLLALGPGLAACRDKGDDSAADAGLSATWVEGYRFHWVAANHRLSFLEVNALADKAQLSLIGGTSTTGQIPEVDCEVSCQEFPFLDDSDIELSWARVEGPGFAVGRGEAEAVANADGVSVTTEIELFGEPQGDLTVILTGLGVDADHPLSGGPSCYTPSYGWHPRHIGAEITDAVLAEGSNTVQATVRFHFRAGLSLEEVRECVDAVVDQVEVPMRAHLLAIVSTGATQAQDLSNSAAYGHRDAGGDLIPQPDPDDASRPLDIDLSNPLLGWTKLDYRFHEQEGLGRGAYLRDLQWRLDAEAGVASGHASNSSLTQLSGFDYNFEGRAVGVELGLPIQRGTLRVNGMPAALDEGERPVVNEYTLIDGEVDAR